MRIFGVNNLVSQCRHLTKCGTTFKTLPFRKELSRLHTVAQKECLTRIAEGSFKNFQRHGKLIEGPSFCVRLRNNGNKYMFVRFMATSPEKDNNVMWYVLAMVITMIGVTYAGVPLYKIFCQQMGLGGNAELAREQNTEKLVGMAKIPDRKIIVKFVADRHSSIQWNFRPQQDQMELSPGETALAFYTANNPTKDAIVGVATYSVVPYAAAPYFHKIQCFCFEEQILNPNEQVDMPVFFYIDPDFDIDPELEDEDQIVLSYTFFEAKEGMSLPLPGYHAQPVKYPN